uniref:Uncharacterized protein n=1 Tax=Leptobrachium leishanense TaxID=445787 RepID=A0A8C5P8P3_9ANUR
CEGCFLHQGKNSSVIHHSCFPWSPRSFGVAELTGAFLLFENVPNSSKVCFLFNHLSDKALDWATALWESKNPIINNYEEFVPRSFLSLT